MAKKRLVIKRIGGASRRQPQIVKSCPDCGKPCVMLIARDFGCIRCSKRFR